MEVLTELKDSDHTSPQYADLIQQITANFDDFKENGVVWGRGGAKAITRKDKDDQFIGYTYKRKKVSVYCLCLSLQHSIKIIFTKIKLFLFSKFKLFSTFFLQKQFFS